MEKLKSISSIRWENTAPVTEFAHNYCVGIGPLQLGVVFVYSKFAELEVAVVVVSGNYVSYVFGKWSSTTTHSFLCIQGQGGRLPAPE